MGKLIYVREMDEYVGPFVSHRDAEHFLTLMAAEGESLEGIEIVEIDSDVNLAANAVSAAERKLLSPKVKRSSCSPNGSC